MKDVHCSVPHIFWRPGVAFFSSLLLAPPWINPSYAETSLNPSVLFFCCCSLFTEDFGTWPVAFVFQALSTQSFPHSHRRSVTCFSNTLTFSPVKTTLPLHFSHRLPQPHQGTGYQQRLPHISYFLTTVSKSSRLYTWPLSLKPFCTMIMWTASIFA